MPAAIDISGQRFTRLVVVRRAKKRDRYFMWQCRCDCGKTIVVSTNSLRSGNTRSCGCYKRDRIIETHRIKNPAETFWGRIQIGPPDACWPWPGKVNNSGYGAFAGQGAHVFAFRDQRGKVKKGLCVLHTCDNRRCCNPAHLFLGTHTINALDAWAKGRNFYQTNPGARPKGERHANHKLTEKTVRVIRKKYATGRYRQIDLARMYGSTQAGVSQIIRNVSWRREQEGTQ